MRRSVYNIAGLIIVVCACSSPLNLAEINNLTRHEFESLFISSDCELFDLRIDIIRQTYENQVNDSTTETRKVPYHKLGFNLGNGLFYDLNNNLSLRIDYLLNIDPKNNFEIEKKYKRKRWHSLFSYSEGNYCIQYPNQNREYTRLKIDRFDDSLSIAYKNRFRYAIVKDDSTLIYWNRRKIIDKIQKKEENFYYQRFRISADEYRCMDNEIILDTKYKVLMSPDRKLIEIKLIRKNSDIPLQKIIKDENTIFIYNRRHYGKKIVLDQGGFILYNNDNLGYECKRIE